MGIISDESGRFALMSPFGNRRPATGARRVARPSQATGATGAATPRRRTALTISPRLALDARDGVKEGYVPTLLGLSVMLPALFGAVLVHHPHVLAHPASLLGLGL